MHENKFEKKVQEKMEELQFVPSDAVWANVDKEINKDKKRRKPIFWLFFLFVLLLLGGGYFLATNNKIKNQVSKVQEDKVQRGKEQESKVQENKVEDGKSQAMNLDKEKNQANKKSIAKFQEKQLQAKKKNEEKKQSVYSDRNREHIKNILSDNNGKTSSSVKSETKELIVDKTSDFKNERNTIAEKNAVDEEKIKNDVVSGNDEKGTDKIESTADKKNKTDSSLNNKENVIADNKTTIKDSVADKKIASNKKQQKKSSVWKIGFTGGAGISNINESLFKSTYVTNPVNYANSATGNPNAVFYKSSQIRQGFSLGAGIFAEKNLSKRISFSAGLNYHYYSTKIYTGNSVDSSIYVYPSTALSFRANSYYRNGNSVTYTNQYHFLELPMSLNFQLNKSQKTPLIWEAGFSLSYLVKSNALHFDPNSGVYYKNNSLFKKTQFNAATALMIGFHFHKSELQLGPQLQYGLTGLLSKSTGNPEHLFYSGLKLSFIPRKK